MTKLLTTSVVRGSHQGESHGGVFRIDLEHRQVDQLLDWNTVDIDWQGRGADRGLRGIAFDRSTIYIAASDELFAFDPEFRQLGAWRNAYLKHCHEIFVFERMLYLTSTGFDSVLAFSLDRQGFAPSLYIARQGAGFDVTVFDPTRANGPSPGNELHLNNVFCNKGGMYLCGLKTGGMLHFNGRAVSMAVQLPAGTHNARPFRDGVLFNDTRADCLRYCSRAGGDNDRALAVPKYDPAALTHTDLDDSRIARQGFGRGLCVLADNVVAAGSSPSTVSLYEIDERRRLLSVNLTMDVRNAIHGLEVWPYG